MSKSGHHKSISIVIPVLNEEQYLGNLLSQLAHSKAPPDGHIEVIVVDGGSNDQTIHVARNAGARVVRSAPGRAKQMNVGAHHAEGDILYFLHADTLPPKNFYNLIYQTVLNGNEAGCFRMQFDSPSRFLKFFAWFSRINHRICRGGDQSLFITTSRFKKMGGFNEDYIIYEDTEFISRLYEQGSFVVLPEEVITSARKYRQKGMVRLQYHFGVIHLKNYLGAGPTELYNYYKRNISG